MASPRHESIIVRGEKRRRIVRSPRLRGEMSRALAFRAVAEATWWRQLDSLVHRLQLPPDAIYQAAFWCWWDTLTRFGRNPIGFELRGEYSTDLPERDRPDWVVLPPRPMDDSPFSDTALHLKVAVELDGYECHYLSEEKVIHGNRRDHRLSYEGWVVCHFTNRQFCADPERAVYTVLQAAAKRYLEHKERIYRDELTRELQRLAAERSGE